MHPILFRVGPFAFRAYGLALAISFLVGSWLALKRGTERGIREDVLTGLFGWILLGSIVGARVHFVLAHPDAFPNALDALKIWEGGLTLYGGLIVAVVASFLYLRHRRQPFLTVADVVAPTLALGEGITRIGCFVNGCCFGRACEGTLAVKFPPGSYASDALAGGAAVFVYPSQLLLSASLLLVFFILLRAERRPWGAGGIFGLFLCLQGIARYLVDFTRYYEPVDRFSDSGPLQTHSQLIALLLFAGGAALVWHARRAQQPAPARKPAGAR